MLIFFGTYVPVPWMDIHGICPALDWFCQVGVFKFLDFGEYPKIGNLWGFYVFLLSSPFIQTWQWLDPPGIYEALELRDGEKRLLGKGVQKVGFFLGFGGLWAKRLWGGQVGCFLILRGKEMKFEGCKMTWI